MSSKDVALLKKHDEDTYDKVRKHYINSLCLYLRSEYRLTISEAEEIAEETIIKACYKKINKYDKKKSTFSTWIYAIAKNESINYIKRKKKEELLEIEIEDKRKDSYILIEIEKILSKEENEIFIEHIIYGYTYKEISLMHNISVFKVMRIVKHAILIIRQHKDDLF